MNKRQQRWPEVKIEIHEGIYLGTVGNFFFTINKLFPLEDENYNEWTHSLCNSYVEGAIQMYYDLWNFGSGDRFYKDMVDCLTEERTRRQLCYNR